MAAGRPVPDDRAVTSGEIGDIVGVADYLAVERDLELSSELTSHRDGSTVTVGDSRERCDGFGGVIAVTGTRPPILKEVHHGEGAHCGDLMPGCKAVIEGHDVAEVLKKGAEHAKTPTA